MYFNLFALAFFAVLYGMIAKKLESTLISGPMLFVTVGLLAGPFGFGLLDVAENDEMLKILAEFTLAMVLFADASLAKTDVLEKNIAIPKRMLLFGLPLTIVLGLGAALLLFPEFTMIEAAIVAIILAPTDAALGKAVVSNVKVPSKIRESLNFESGLNDGIAVPLILLCFAMISSHGSGDASLLVYLAKAIGIGGAVGLGLTAITIFLIKKAAPKGWISHTWQSVIVVALSIAIFSLSESMHGSGFIGCFVGGILFGMAAKKEKESYIVPAEGVSELLSVATWTYFGSAGIYLLFTEMSWQIFLYGILSLTIVRMLPVFLVLLGTDTSKNEKLFAGWFGPRGLASIVFAVMLMEHSTPQVRTILLTITFTILLSVILHGFSANPLIAWLAKKGEANNANT